MAVGTARYRAVLQDLGGRPVPSARVRTLGRPYAVSDDRGFVALDSLPRGPATLEVQAIGYVPERRVVTVGESDTPPDTILLASLKSALDTIRVTAGRDETGFDRRRHLGTGQFLTAADIERENPGNATGLLRTKVGLRYQMNGNSASIAMSHGPRGNCTPYVFIDGFPAPRVNRVAGIAMMDLQIAPQAIGGVEYYLEATQIPPEFLKWIGTPACGAIAFWTRERLNLPQMRNPTPP